jgi:hypothetical protein
MKMVKNVLEGYWSKKYKAIMRKRYRKMLVHNYSKLYSREKKRELLKGELKTQCLCASV